MKKAPEIVLTLVAHVLEEYGRRSSKDRRVKVNWYVAEYKDSDGNIYRKAFETKTKKPYIPESGTHESLNNLEYQWEQE